MPQRELITDTQAVLAESRKALIALESMASKLEIYIAILQKQRDIKKERGEKNGN